MSDLTSIAELSRYADEANRMVVEAVCRLSEGQLDQRLDLGMGSVRTICQHLLAGEVTWLARLSGHADARWPAQAVPEAPRQMLAVFGEMARDRQAVLAGLDDAQLDRVQSYRDSKGSLFQATLRQMLLQMITHATHHRAQAVNALRRVGGKPPEVDYMYQVRRPV